MFKKIFKVSFSIFILTAIGCSDKTVKEEIPVRPVKFTEVAYL